MRHALYILLFLTCCVPSKEVQQREDDPTKEGQWDNTLMIATDKSKEEIGATVVREGYVITQDKYGVLRTEFQEVPDEMIRLRLKLIMGDTVKMTGTCDKEGHDPYRARYLGHNSIGKHDEAWEEMKRVAKRIGEIVEYTVE